MKCFTKHTIFLVLILHASKAVKFESFTKDTLQSQGRNLKKENNIYGDGYSYFGSKKHGYGSKKYGYKCQKHKLSFKQKDWPDELPNISGLIEDAFPTWCIDEDENRVDCSDGGRNGRFSPLYFTKRYSGADPVKGGYPTNIDIQYAFEFAAPYFGQACAGSPHICREDFDGTKENCKKCPKVKTDTDNGPYGPGHVPPHISLAAVTWAYNDNLDIAGAIENWFDFDQNACRILPSILLKLIRNYYPREEDKSVYYPPPFSDAGGAYPLEFVNLVGDSCGAEKEKHSEAGELDCFENHSPDVSYPDDLLAGHGSPHYCTKEGKDNDVNNDWCPYIFFGPNRGKYRHPHIAYAAIETYLANLVMPYMCGTKWDDSNYPAEVTTEVAFPVMDGEKWEAQPLIDNDKWTWPNDEGKKKKPVVGIFTTDLVIPTSD